MLKRLLGIEVRNMQGFISHPEVYSGDWVIKISEVRGLSYQIMVFMHNHDTLETTCEFFKSEREAVLFLECILTKYSLD